MELNFRRSYPFINSATFTKHNTLHPLPNEIIHYYNPNTKFSLVLGNGAPAYTSRYNSYSGTFYITNKRVIYRPIKPNKFFDSFNISLGKIVETDECYFRIQVMDNVIANCYVNTEDAQNVFCEILKKIKYEEVLWDVVEDEALPYYCQVYK